MGRGLIAVLTALLVVGSGCGSDAGSDRTSSARPSAPTSASTSTTPWAALPGLGRCGPQPPTLADAQFRRTTLRRHGRVLPAVTIGRGPTVVVLVHQTDGGGLCGWLSFAARIAAVPGQVALAFDLCGYGDSDCPARNTSVGRQVAQVRMAIDRAERLGATRIVLVGASMGGSLTVLTAARDDRVDAAVDLSGPDDWDGAVVHERAAGVQVPLLVAMADDEGADAVAAARATAGAAGPGSVFVPADAGHGYVLLEEADGGPTPLAGQVLDWIAAG